MEYAGECNYFCYNYNRELSSALLTSISNFLWHQLENNNVLSERNIFRESQVIPCWKMIITVIAVATGNTLCHDLLHPPYSSHITEPSISTVPSIMSIMHYPLSLRLHKNITVVFPLPTGGLCTNKAFNNQICLSRLCNPTISTYAS